MKTVPLPPLFDEVEAVVEELAEQREPGVERRRQALVRRDVGQVDVVAVHCDAERLERGIAHHAGGIEIGVRCDCVAVAAAERSRRGGLICLRASRLGSPRRARPPRSWRSASRPAPDTRRRTPA